MELFQGSFSDSIIEKFIKDNPEGVTDMLC